MTEIEQLTQDVKQLKEIVEQQSKLLKSIVRLIYIADTDMQNHIDLLER